MMWPRPRARDGRDPRELASMDVATHLADPSLKRKYVSIMFDVIAPGYDAFTRAFSGGKDRAWKTRLATEGALRAVPRPRVLDLACGTGDLGIEMARLSGASLALGLDLSPQMLAEAQRRLSANQSGLRLAACDILALCLDAASMDVVSVGYGLRNVADLGQALREIARVLRPGGILLTLDLYKPAGRIWRELFLWYTWRVGRFAGWLWHREPMAYGYLAPSIRRYLTISEFESALAAAGFTVEWRSSRLGGAIGLHVARLVYSRTLPVRERHRSMAFRVVGQA